MKISTLKTRAISTLLSLAVVMCYSMVALAGESKLAAEIVIAGKHDAVVTVNGEEIKSGRTIFSSSVITTPADASAFVTVKNVGELKIAPSTTMAVRFDENGISGSIEKGKMTVLRADEQVSMTGPNGKTALLTVGESVSTVQDDDDDTGAYMWFGLAVFGGAVAAAVIYTMSRGDDTVPSNVSGTF